MRIERMFGYRRFACASLAAIFFSALAAPSPAAPAAAPPTIDDALAAIRAYAPRAMAEQGAPGLSVAITDRTHTLAIITLGYANVDAKTPVTPATRFAIGSITKSMTALALLELRDEHRIDLNANVVRYLPWFSINSGGKSILVHELLSHTAGTPDDYSLAPGYGFDIWAMRATHTLFAPGTSWSYSNDGLATIGAILATVDRRPWPDALQARVLDPLGMAQTSPVFTPQTLADAAVGYEFRDADRPAPPHPALVASHAIDFVDPAGSVISTPEDMARYLRFYLNDGVANGRALLTPATFAAMTQPDRYRNGKAAGSATPVLSEAPQFYRQYGYALSIFGNDPSSGGDHVIGHTGGVSGYTACMQANLTRGFGAVAMSNLVEAPLHPCAIVLYAMRVLRAQSLGEPLPPAPPAPADPALTPNGADYTGTYTAVDGSSLSVTGVTGRAAMIDRGASYALYPRGPDIFWSSDPRFVLFLLHFGRNASRHVVDVTYGSQWFGNERYYGPRTWSHPHRYDAYVGRYENTFWGSLSVTRVLVVKGRLTFDGLDPLTPRPDGSFTLGTDVIRFDAIAGGKAQRMTIDAADLYRVELP